MDDLRKKEIEQAKLLLDETNRGSQASFHNASPFEPLIIERLEMYGYAHIRGTGLTRTAVLGILGISGIQEFINSGKTHLEVNQEEEKLARELAINNAEESLKLTRTSLKWTKIVAITSIVFSAFSLFYTIRQNTKDSVVEIKNLNEINFPNLEKEVSSLNTKIDKLIIQETKEKEK